MTLKIVETNNEAKQSLNFMDIKKGLMDIKKELNTNVSSDDDKSCSSQDIVYELQDRLHEKYNSPKKDLTASVGRTIEPTNDKIETIVKAMKKYPEDSKLTLAALEILEYLAAVSSTEEKAMFVSSGALEEFLTVLQNCEEKKQNALAIPAAALHCLANLSEDATEVLKNDHLLPSVPLVHRIMKLYTGSAEVQRYGCSLLQNLSNPLLHELVAAGSLPVILHGMASHSSDKYIQEHGGACLYNLLAICSDELLQDICPKGDTSGISTILAGMKACEFALPVQKYGLLVLSRIINKDQANYELVLSEGGVAVALAAMKNWDTDEEIAQIGSQLLKGISRVSLDIQGVIAARGGVEVVLNVMRKHVSSTSIQDPAMATIRNLCTHPGNRPLVTVAGGISTILATLTIHEDDAAIQAYGCDALGRLAVEFAETIHKENGVQIAINALEIHRNHPGVQDRAVFLLFELANSCPAALQKIKWKEILPLLEETRVPSKSKDKLQALIQKVQGKTGWFQKLSSFN